MNHVKVIARSPAGGRNDGTRVPTLSGYYCIHPQNPVIYEVYQSAYSAYSL